MEDLKQASGEIWEQLRPPKFVSKILCCVALLNIDLQFIFILEQLFYENYSTLDSHTNTVISHAVVYSSRWLPKLWQGLLMVRFIGQ